MESEAFQEKEEELKTEALIRSLELSNGVFLEAKEAVRGTVIPLWLLIRPKSSCGQEVITSTILLLWV